MLQREKNQCITKYKYIFIIYRSIIINLEFLEILKTIYVWLCDYLLLKLWGGKGFQTWIRKAIQGVSSLVKATSLVTKSTMWSKLNGKTVVA